MAEPGCSQILDLSVTLESQSGGRITGGAAGGWFAVPFAIRLWIALAFVITASIFAFLQSPRPDAFQRPPALLSFSWWRYPLEWNAPSRLPKIGVSLNAIQVAPNTSHVWAVGRQGMVVRSTDGGNTWEIRGITEDQLVSPSASPTPTPSPTPTSTRPPASRSSFLSLPDLIPTAHAAESRADRIIARPTASRAHRGADVRHHSLRHSKANIVTDPTVAIDTETTDAHANTEIRARKRRRLRGRRPYRQVRPASKRNPLSRSNSPTAFRVRSDRRKTGAIYN